LERKERLARAAHTGEGEHPVGSHKLEEFIHLVFPADEAGELDGQVVRERCQ
jgi:hypothetical protein